MQQQHTPPTTPIEPDVINGALLELEALIDQHGWDQTPRLFNIYRHDDGTRIPLALRPVPIPHAMWQNEHPSHVIAGLADTMTSPEAAYSLLRTHAWHLWVGAVACVEAYTEPKLPDGVDPAEFYAQLAVDTATNGWASRADAREIRVVQAVTIPAVGFERPLRLWAVDRCRGDGEEPEVSHLSGSECADDIADDQAHGSVHCALREYVTTTHALALRIVTSGLYTPPDYERATTDPAT